MFALFYPKQLRESRLTRLFASRSPSQSTNTLSLDLSIPTSSPKPPSSPRPIQPRDFPELEDAEEAHFTLSPHAVPYVPLAERTVERPFSLPQYRRCGTTTLDSHFAWCGGQTGRGWSDEELSAVLMRVLLPPIGFIHPSSNPPPPYTRASPPSYSAIPDRVTQWVTSWRLSRQQREVRDGILGADYATFEEVYGVVKIWDRVKVSSCCLSSFPRRD